METTSPQTHKQCKELEEICIDLAMKDKQERDRVTIEERMNIHCDYLAHESFKEIKRDYENNIAFVEGLVNRYITDYNVCPRATITREGRDETE